MVGSACWKLLDQSGYKHLIGPSSTELDLTKQNEVRRFFKTEKPDVVINAAAKVGGIMANSNYPYEFLLKNLQIQNNLIDVAHEFNTQKFIFLGSSCIYPKFSDQPIKEEYLLTSELEPTNQWYAIAKIAGVKLIEALRIQYNRDYVALMPTNLYGPGDNFDLNTSHVLPAMIHRFHLGKIKNSESITLWGTGTPRREFLHVNDLANAVKLMLENHSPHHLLNVGFGEDISILELSELVKEIVGYRGTILWDKSKPDGTPRKLLDSSRISELGFKPNHTLKEGITNTYDYFVNNKLFNIKET